MQAQVLALEPVLALAGELVPVLVLVEVLALELIVVLTLAWSRSAGRVSRFLELLPARLIARLVRLVFRRLVVACAH